MILLIGGSSHVGKTLVAQKLMERTHFPYVSLDHLKMAFIRTKKTDLTVEDDYEMRYFLWPFAAEMVKTAIENDQNMIVEGGYIRSNFDTITEKANVIERRLDDELDMERLIICSKEFRKDCEASGTPNIDITDTFNADEMTERIIREAGL